MTISIKRLLRVTDFGFAELNMKLAFVPVSTRSGTWFKADIQTDLPRK